MSGTTLPRLLDCKALANEPARLHQQRPRRRVQVREVLTLIALAVPIVVAVLVMAWVVLSRRDAA